MPNSSAPNFYRTWFRHDHRRVLRGEIRHAARVITRYMAIRTIAGRKTRPL